MNVERIVVRLFADVSSYLTSFNKAENRLKSFQDSMAKAETRLLRSIEGAELRHQNSVQNATNRFGQITKLANRNYEYAIKSADKMQEDSMRKASRRQMDMVRQANLSRDKTIAASHASLATNLAAIQKSGLASSALMKRQEKNEDRKLADSKKMAERRYKMAVIANSTLDAAGRPMDMTRKQEEIAKKALDKQSEAVQKAKDAFAARYAHLSAKAVDPATGMVDQTKIPARQQAAIDNARSKMDAAILAAQDKYKDTLKTAKIKTDPNTGQPVARTAAQWKTVDEAARRRDAAIERAEERRLSNREKIHDAANRRMAGLTLKENDARAAQQAVVAEATAKRDAAVLDASRRFQRAKENAERIRANAGTQSVEARDKAIEQARLRFENSVRNADFRKTMTTRAANLQFQDDKTAANAQKQKEAMSRSAELRDAISRDLRIVHIAATSAFGFVAYEAVRMGSKFEMAKIELEVMTKSAEKAESVLTGLQKLGVESPFTTAEMIQSAKQVKAFGFETDQIVPILSRLGDVASGTGADMDRIILAFGQVRTTGRLMGQELRQFTNAGVPIMEYLAKAMGKTEAEIPNLVRQGKVGFSDVAQAFNLMTSEGGLFNNMMSRVNKETTYGRWQNLVENFQLMAKDMGQAAFQGLGLHEILTSIAESFKGADKGALLEFFGNIKKIFQSIWMGGKQVVAFVSSLIPKFDGAAGAVQRWATNNQKVVRTVAALVIGITALLVTIRAISITLLVVNAVAKIVLSSFALLGAAVTLFTSLSSVAALVGTILSAWPIAAVIAGLTAVVYLLSELGTFDGFGDHFTKDWGQIKNDFSSGIMAIKEAWMAGNLEDVFDTLWAGIKYGFHLTVLYLQTEFGKMLVNMMIRLEGFIGRSMLQLQKNADLAGKYVIAGFTRDDDDYRRANDAWDREIAAHDNRVNRDIQSSNTRIDEQFETRKAALEPYRKSFMDKSFDARIRSRMPNETDTAKNVYQYATLPLRMARDMDMSTEENKRLRGQAIDNAFDNIFGNKEKGTLGLKAMPEKVAERTTGLQAVMGGMAVPSVEKDYSEKWMKVYDAIHNIEELGKEGKWGSPEMERASSRLKDLTKDLDTWSAEMMKAEGATKKLIDLVASYPEHVTHFARDLEKEIMEGMTPEDKFRKTMHTIDWAFNGPLNINPTAAVGALGGPLTFGQEKNFTGLIDKEKQAFGRYRAFEELSRSVGDHRTEGVAAMQFGSREAADTIARNNLQQLSVQEQVLQVLRDSHELSKGQAVYMKQVAEAMDNIQKQSGDSGGPAKNTGSIFFGPPSQ